MNRGPLHIKCTDVFFSNNCSITAVDSVVIGNHCKFDNNLVIVDHDHKIEDRVVTDDLISKLVMIGNNVWCVANVTVVKGVTIGDRAIIAARVVATKDVEAHSLVGRDTTKRLK